ncbi:MAG: carbohydrate ABC transporter permease [Planctomycetota bacterium]
MATMRTQRVSRLAGKSASFVVLAALAALFILPLLWMMATSMLPIDQALSSELRFLPKPEEGGGLVESVELAAAQAAENYPTVWNDPIVTFPLYLRNTLIVAGLSVIGMVLSSAIAAYGFARVRWRYRERFFWLVLATMMIPFPVLMVPLFMIFSELGWVGTLRPLWVPAWFANGFNVFMLRQFFRAIPQDLDEAARIDGCGHIGIFRHIIVPLSLAPLGLVAVFHFMFVWNDFLGPLVFLTDQSKFTLALGLQLYQSQSGSTPWNLLMAASTMMVLPVLLVFILLQDSFLRGGSTEGLKE